MGAHVLEINELKKAFGGVKAVNGLSICVDVGEILSIIGPNGAGKTTVFNLITGLYRPDSGVIRLFGDDITFRPSYVLARRGIARTFQNLRLFKDLTVAENISAACMSRHRYGFLSSIFRTGNYHSVTGAVKEKTGILLDFFNLSQRSHYYASNLPYGEQRRLELARALALEPKVLLVDEPGAGMNPSEIQDFIIVLKQIKEKFSTTIVIIEHQMELVMNISDRIVVMDFGEKIMEGSPEEVKNDSRVIEAYLGEEFKF